MNKATTLNFGKEKINDEVDLKDNTVEETEAETEVENALRYRFHSAFEILDMSLYCADNETDMVQLVTHHTTSVGLFDWIFHAAPSFHKNVHSSSVQVSVLCCTKC